MLLRRMLNFRTIEKHQSRASETIWDLTIRRPAQWFKKVYKTGANPFVIVYTREWPGDSWEGLRFRDIPRSNLMIAAFWDQLICIPLSCAIRFENAVIFDRSTPTYGFNKHMWGPVQTPGLQWLSIMLTSSNGNIFRVTSHLCGEFTDPRWIPRTKASDAELWCFLWSASE